MEAVAAWTDFSAGNDQRSESVFVRRDPDRSSIESPGGFAPNVMVESVLDRQVPRNRVIAESLDRVGFEAYEEDFELRSHVLVTNFQRGRLSGKRGSYQAY